MSAYRAITQRYNAMGLRWTDSCTCPNRANSFAVNKYLLLRRYQSPLIDGERLSERQWHPSQVSQMRRDGRVPTRSV